MRAPLCTHSYVCGCPCVCVCVCEHAEGCERGFGWSGSAPRPPRVRGARRGAAGGGCRLPPAAGRLGGGGAKFGTSANRGLFRNAGSHFTGRFAKELGAPLQSWKEAGGCCREPLALSSPGALWWVCPPGVPPPRNSETRLGALQRAQVKLFGIDIHIWELFGEPG